MAQFGPKHPEGEPRINRLALSQGSDTVSLVINTAPVENNPNDLRKLARASLIALSLLGFIFGLLSIKIASMMPPARAIFDDMLHGQELPQLTRFFMDTQAGWIPVGILLTIASLTVGFAIRNHTNAVYVLLCVIILELLMSCAICWALYLPMVTLQKDERRDRISSGH